MNSDKYNRLVNLLCPTCGNTNLVNSDNQENRDIKCSSCSRVMTREELICENSESIDANIDEIKEELLKDIKKEFSNIFKKSFR